MSHINKPKNVSYFLDLLNACLITTIKTPAIIAIQTIPVLAKNVPNGIVETFNKFPAVCPIGINVAKTENNNTKPTIYIIVDVMSMLALLLCIIHKPIINNI